MPEKTADLTIIGAGPAGVGAAVQASLYGLKVLVAGDGRIGGRLALGRRVENFPGLSSGKSQPGLNICRHLERWLAVRKVPVANDCATEVGHGKGCFLARGKSGRSYRSKAVIIATGVVPRSWSAPRGGCGRRLMNNWREVPFRRGLRVAVIGGGETAFDQACSLAERGIEAAILVRGPRSRAYPGLAAEASRLGVKVYKNKLVDSVSCGRDGSLVLSCGAWRFHCDYVLPAVGHRPQMPKIGKAARQRLGRGLWLAGDVREKLCRQAAVAFGDGVRAAMLAWEFLRKGR